MTKPHTVLEMTRIDAQNLHKKISADLGRAEEATWADVKAVQADITALGAKMKTLAADQAEEVKTALKAAITRLEAAGKLVEDKTLAARDGVRQANATMLEAAHRAAQSLSAAVAASRTKLAKAIAPQKVVA